MGHKKVCFICRKAFSLYIKHSEKVNLKCPECGEACSIFHHLFKTPKKTEKDKWKLAEFLKDHGFFFQRVYKKHSPGVYTSQRYPKTMAEARKFVKDLAWQPYRLKWDSEIQDFSCIDRDWK